MDWFNNIIQAALAQSALEWIAVITSLLYVILAAKENIWCWAFGIVGVVCSFVIYMQSKFFLDGSLQVYYFFMSIYGWWMWSKKKKSPQPQQIASTPITTRKLYWHLSILVLGVATAFPLAKISEYFGGTLPFIDALTTSFSLLATYMVAKKILENWLYWIVIDLICVWAYWIKDLQLFSILFLCYTVIAIFGYLQWRKKPRSISVDI